MVRYWCLRNSSVCIYENIPFHWITSSLYRMRCSNVPWQMSGKFFTCSMWILFWQLLNLFVRSSLKIVFCDNWCVDYLNIDREPRKTQRKKQQQKKRIEEKITIDEHLFASSCCLTAVTIQTTKCPHWYSRVEKHTIQANTMSGAMRQNNQFKTMFIISITSMN